MKTKDIYINGMSSISIQKPLCLDGIFAPESFNTSHVRCQEPVFKEFLDPIAARRMSRIIKRAIVTATKALDESGIASPGAIVTGTGLGCIEDTEKFLEAMIANNEQFLQPTYFIQSTHNTIGSQIAINRKCNGYNNTYIHRGVSFENALMDVLLLFGKQQINDALVTGNDEMTPAYFSMLAKLNYWRSAIADTSQLIRVPESGSFAGEGSVSLVLSTQQSATSYCCIVGFDLRYKPSDVQQWVGEFLAGNGISVSDVDLVFTGKNGDVDNDAVYQRFSSGLFDDRKLATYKQVCGEYFTASAFGLMTAAACLRNGDVPSHLMECGGACQRPGYVLLYNHFQNKDHALTLLRSV